MKSRGRPGMRAVLLMIACAISIPVGAYLLSGANSDCVQLCAIGLRVGQGQGIVAHVSYLGKPLEDEKLRLIVDGRYGGYAYTNSSAYISAVAPLGLGRNNIYMSYGAGHFSGSVMYLGGYLYIIMIPVGALAFLIMRRMGSVIGGRRDIVVYGEDGGADGEGDRERLRNAFSMACARGQSMRFVKGLPVSGGDLHDELYAGAPANRPATDRGRAEYLARKLRMLGIAEAEGEMVGTGKVTAIEAAARRLYDMVVRGEIDGTPFKSNVQGFAKRNGILPYEALAKDRAFEGVETSGKLLVLASPEERRRLDGDFVSSNGIGPALVMLEACGMLGVIG